MYPKIEVRLFISDAEKAWTGEDGAVSAQPLTVAIAKELLGWREESENIHFKSDYLLLDKYGKKIRCSYNQTNRPYYPQLTEDWMLEILRGKWKFNGEPIIVDKYGMIHDGQHTLIGLVLASQEWDLDKRRDKTSQKWQGIWKEEPFIDKLVVLGIEADDATVNTINTGKRRSEEDVLYRSERLKGKPDKDRLGLAKVLKFAVRLLWSRTSQSLASLAPRRPHSELFEFLARHERVWECAEFIYSENDGTKLSPLNVAPGTAAALLYMMGCAATDADTYAMTNDQSGMDWKLWDKALTFWTEILGKGKATEALCEALLRIPEEVGGTYGRDLRVATIIKAWNLYSDGKKVTEEGVEVATTVNENHRSELAEFPRIGGIDVEYDEGLQPPVQFTPSAVDGGTAECLKGGEHEYVTEANETFCKKCLDPAPKTKRK